MIETKKQVEQALNMILENDTKGLDILYNCMSKTMLFVAKSYIKDDLLAEDVVQDSFLDIVKNIKKYEKNNGYGWICKIVKNNAINALKKENKYINYNDDIFLIPSEENVEKKTENQLLNSLYPPIVKSMIYMKYFMDMTVREIAKELKVSKSYVSKEIIKAEKYMKTLINVDK